jgi:hypothetical protein
VRRIARSHGIGWAGSFAAAALFALHPIVAEPVSWCTGRKDLLAAAGVLLGYWAARRALSGHRTGRWLAVHAAGFVIAVGAKPIGIVLPALVLVDAACRRELRELLKQHLGRLAAAELALAPLWIALSMHLHEAFGGMLQRSLPASLAFAAQHFALQLRNVAAPLWLSPVYLEYFPRSLGSTWGIAGVAAVCAWAMLLALAARMWDLRRRNVVLLSLLWVVVTFAPASGLLPMRRGPADSYFYLSLVGLALLAGLGVQHVASSSKRLGGALVGALVVGYAPLSFAQSLVWASPSSVWHAAVEQYPQEEYAHERLADALVFEHRPGAALDEYARALELGPLPDKPAKLRQVARGCFMLRRFDCAVEWYGRVVRHYPPALGSSLGLLSSALAAGEPIDAANSSPSIAVARRDALQELDRCDGMTDGKLRQVFRKQLASDPVPVTALEALLRAGAAPHATRFFLSAYQRNARRNGRKSSR